MRIKINKKITSCILCMMLIVAMAFSTSGCVARTQEGPTSSQDAGNIQVLGKGQIKFMFDVVDKDGNVTGFEIHTDKKTVGEALLELKLIAGDSSEYGLYVKTVNGITADYNVDKSYWAFYINGEYATTGVDSTDVTAGATYSFKVEK